VGLTAAPGIENRPIQRHGGTLHADDACVEFLEIAIGLVE
jgi:hypothetical protein